MIKVKINGVEYEAQQGETILDVARRNGIYIPAICYSDRFGAIGACRICVVEIVGQKRPMLSCAMKVKDGMEILTDSDVVVEARKKIVYQWDKFHPLQCGVCDKSGECELQNINYELNITENPLESVTDALSVPDRTVHHEWKIIHHDANLCIQCRRCVTICDKVVNFGILALVKKDWGGKEIDTKDGKPLDCEFCGQCVSICPTGAMSSKLFKYRARPWELEKIESTCVFCGSGCSMELNVKNNEVLRVTSRNDTPNRANLCNLGRFGYSVTGSENNLYGCKIMGKEVTYDEAIGKAVEMLSKVGSSGIMGISGARCSFEEAFALRLMFERALRNVNLDSFASTHIGKAVRFLGEGLDALSEFERIGESDLVVCFGGDFANEMPRVDWEITRAVKLRKKAKLIQIYWRETKFNSLKPLVLNYRPGDEVSISRSLVEKLRGSEGTFEIPEEIVEAIKSAGNITFVVGEEALERPGGETIIRAVSDFALLLGNGVSLLFSSKYSNAVGDIYAGVSYGFSPGGFPEERSVSLVELVDLVRENKVKTLFLLGADLFDVMSDEDALFVLGRANVVYVGAYKNRTAEVADVVIPISSFAHSSGHFVNIEGRVNSFHRALDDSRLSGLDVIMGISSACGYNISPAEVASFAGKAFVQLKGHGVGLEDPLFNNRYAGRVGVVVFSKFRAGLFSSLAQGARIASPEPYILISEGDAEELSLSDGDRIVLEGRGVVEGRVRISMDIPQGVFGIPLWYDDLNAYNFSGSFSNVFPVKRIEKVSRNG